MDLTILPLKIITFQILILLVAIAAEAFIFKLKLQWHPKTALEYAAFINLLSACTGWALFLSILSLLPDFLLDRVMIYVMFGDKSGLQLLRALLFFIFFLFSLILKLIGIQLAEFLWYKKPTKGSLKFHLQMQDLKNRQSTIAIAAHICSHFLIVLIWLIQTQDL